MNIIDKEEHITKLAREIIKGVNKQKTRKKEDRVLDIDTLCDFGMLGLWTPRQIAEAFYNSFKKYEYK